MKTVAQAMHPENETAKLIRDFNNTIDIWISELERYNFEQLLAKPFLNGWSLGQVYMHIIHNTQHYIEQIRICVTGNSNFNEKASTAAQKMFRDNEFPNAMLEGPPSNADTPQPAAREQLIASLLEVKDEMNKAALQIAATSFKGKTKHPGLLYFTANEWLQFGEMHLRHHLRQKKRIDEALLI